MRAIRSRTPNPNRKCGLAAAARPDGMPPAPEGHTRASRRRIHRAAIFVHGCFWHGHDCPEGRLRHSFRQDYWLPKFAGNHARDPLHVGALEPGAGGF